MAILTGSIHDTSGITLGVFGGNAVKYFPLGRLQSATAYGVCITAVFSRKEWNDMFSIYGGATEFTQYAVDQMIRDPDLVVGSKVIFHNRSGRTRVVTAHATGLCRVPNSALWESGYLLVIDEDGQKTRFYVAPAEMPDNYDLTDNIPAPVVDQADWTETDPNSPNYIVNKPINSATLEPPAQYELVVGDTFELFWKGIIRSVLPETCYIKASCTKGNPYRRRFVFTPTASDIGTHVLNLELHDGQSGALLDTKDVKLVVKAKGTSPATEKVIMYVGDSLTMGGYVPEEFDRRLTASGGSPTGDGLTNISFIGTTSDTGTSTPYTGNSGWQFLHYNAEGSPFWNADKGAIDFAKFVTDHNKDHLDYVYVLLGWNSARFAEDENKAHVRTFIDNVHAAFPSCKVVLMGIQIPSFDGCAGNYGANTKAFSDYGGLVEYVFNLNQWYTDLAEEYDNVSYINISGQFDSDYNMPTAEIAVNVRNTATETRQNNGIHPTQAGCFQIADACYRHFTHEL